MKAKAYTIFTVLLPHTLRFPSPLLFLPWFSHFPHCSQCSQIQCNIFFSSLFIFVFWSGLVEIENAGAKAKPELKFSTCR